MTDNDGCCSTYFGFLAIDCLQPTCQTSRNYGEPRIVIIYDGRSSGVFYGHFGGSGFSHQGMELANRLIDDGYVELYHYTTAEDFIGIWNGLNGEYDSIYILGHGIPGELRFKGSVAIANQGAAYSFSDLNKIPVKTLNLYCCNGATIDVYGGSIAEYMATITGGAVNAVKNGKLNFTWEYCLPVPASGGYWCTVK